VENLNQPSSFQTSKKERKINPLAIVLIITALFLPLTIYAFQYIAELRTKALPTEEPKKIEVTNILDTSATVSWITPSGGTIGFIKYGPTAKLESVGYDVRDTSGTNGDYTVHYVELVDLTPETQYYYTIDVGDKEYNNDGKMYSFKTGEIFESVRTPRPLKGEVEDASGSEEELIIYMYTQKGTKISSKISV